MTGDSEPIGFRLAHADDGDAVGRLHAASWRAHYRGSLSEAYLAGPIEDERRLYWADHLTSPQNSQIVVVAEEDGGLLGFVCAFVEADPVWGTLIDNLHVTLARKKSGIGRALMHDLARRLADRAPDRPVHLEVIDKNLAAQTFYERIGGQPAGRDQGPMPDGSIVSVLRIVWTSPAALLDGTTAA